MALNIGDALLLLGSIEQQARQAREAITQSTLVRQSPDPILMPGQPPRPKNSDIANALMHQFQGSVAQLRSVAGSFFAQLDGAAQQPDHHGNGIAGRIGAQLNGEAHGEAL